MRRTSPPTTRPFTRYSLRTRTVDARFRTMVYPLAHMPSTRRGLPCMIWLLQVATLRRLKPACRPAPYLCTTCPNHILIPSIRSSQLLFPDTSDPLTQRCESVFPIHGLSLCSFSNTIRRPQRLQPRIPPFPARTVQGTSRMPATSSTRDRANDMSKCSPRPAVHSTLPGTCSANSSRSELAWTGRIARGQRIISR